MATEKLKISYNAQNKTWTNPQLKTIRTAINSD
jgi:hypothetical protein